jgi:hypothetical protein
VLRSKRKLIKSIRFWLVFVIGGLFLSGITAFPLESELRWLTSFKDDMPRPMAVWVERVHAGVSTANKDYPFLSYGTDWLAFAHIMIAIAYIGPWINPVKNSWVITWGIICSVLIIPLALIAGPIRDIPFFHQVIDCLFGIICFIPLLIIRRRIKQLERL